MIHQWCDRIMWPCSCGTCCPLTKNTIRNKLMLPCSKLPILTDIKACSGLYEGQAPTTQQHSTRTLDNLLYSNVDLKKHCTTWQTKVATTLKCQGVFTDLPSMWVGQTPWLSLWNFGSWGRKVMSGGERWGILEFFGWWSFPAPVKPPHEIQLCWTRNFLNSPVHIKVQ